jgi:hypothetical protein
MGMSIKCFNSSGLVSSVNFQSLPEGVSGKEMNKKCRGDLFSGRVPFLASRTHSVVSTLFSVFLPQFHDKKRWNSLPILAAVIIDIVTTPIRLLTLPYAIYSNAINGHCYNAFEKLLAEKFNIQPWDLNLMEMEMKWTGTPDNARARCEIKGEYDFLTHSFYQKFYCYTAR